MVRFRKERLLLGLTLLRILLAIITGILILNEKVLMIGNEKMNVATVFFIATALIAFLDGVTSRKILENPY